MKKTLTEQWREGKLPEDTYYVQFICGRYGIYEFEQLKGFGFDNDLAYIKEVLAPVPSYQTWKEFQQHFVDRLELEVKLKKAYEELEKQSIETVCLKTEKEQLVSKNEQLEKKLAIATKALKEYANCKPTEWMSCVTADKALKEMEGVK